MEVLVQDQTFSGEVLDEILLKIDKEFVTVKDVIEERVIAEVAKYNEKAGDYFTGLVQPTESEKELNGYKLNSKRKIDAEEQVYIALDAFHKNGYFVLIGDEQAESLETQVLVDSTVPVSFVKLTPLVGG